MTTWSWTVTPLTSQLPLSAFPLLLPTHQMTVSLRHLEALVDLYAIPAFPLHTFFTRLSKSLPCKRRLGWGRVGGPFSFWSPCWSTESYLGSGDGLFHISVPPHPVAATWRRSEGISFLFKGDIDTYQHRKFLRKRCLPNSHIPAVKAIEEMKWIPDAMQLQKSRAMQGKLGHSRWISGVLRNISQLWGMGFLPFR